MLIEKWSNMWQCSDVVYFFTTRPNSKLHQQFDLCSPPTGLLADFPHLRDTTTCLQKLNSLKQITCSYWPHQPLTSITHWGHLSAAEYDAAWMKISTFQSEAMISCQKKVGCLFFIRHKMQPQVKKLKQHRSRISFRVRVTWNIWYVGSDASNRLVCCGE